MKNANFARTAVVVALAAAFSANVQAVVPTEMAANDAVMTQIGAYTAWARGYTGKGVVIGFVDTGADLKNNDLKNVILSKSPYAATITDVARGHGTSMISLAAGAKDGTGIIGVAYDAKVLAYAGGISGILLMTDVSNGIKWNADNGANIINLSLGTSQSAATFAASYTSPAVGQYVRKALTADAYANTTLLASLQYATAKGSIAVMAAGNDGNAVPTSPANLAVKMDAAGNLLLGGRAIIVGAVDKNNVIATFSNRAGNICQTMVNGACADRVQIKDFFLVAPGGGLVWEANATGGTTIVQGLGTSEATAIVSGGVAVIKQAWPTLKPEQIVQILLKTATDLGAPGVDVVYGNGLMNLDAATKPIGALTLAKITSVSTTAIVGGPTPLSATGLTGGVLTKQSFSGSSVMQNTQAIDGMGRNFTVNMTSGMSNSMLNYSPATVYGGLSATPLTYVNMGYNGDAVFTSSTMSGARVGHTFDNTYVAVETGNATERGSVLGSHGAGGLALGDARTHWNAVHVATPVTAHMDVFGSVAQGTTVAGAAKDSLITGFTPLTTRSWTVGVAQRGVITTKDSLTLTVSAMPHVIRGTASVAGVTGFVTSSVTDEGAVATPVTSTEQVGLSSDYRQYTSSVAYAVSFGKTSRVQFNVAVQSDNAGTAVRPTVQMAMVHQF